MVVTVVVLKVVIMLVVVVVVVVVVNIMNFIPNSFGISSYCSMVG